VNFFFVGSLVNILKLLVLGNECTCSEYSFEFIITIVLPLSACGIIAFSVVNFLFSDQPRGLVVRVSDY